MNISTNHSTSIDFAPSYTGEDDGGCTTGGDFPHPGALSAFGDGVDPAFRDAEPKKKPAPSGNGGGTVTCPDGTQPVTTIEGQKVTVECVDKEWVEKLPD